MSESECSLFAHACAMSSFATRCTRRCRCRQITSTTRCTKSTKCLMEARALVVCHWWCSCSCMLHVLGYIGSWFPVACDAVDVVREVLQVRSCPLCMGAGCALYKSHSKTHVQQRCFSSGCSCCVPFSHVFQIRCS